MISMSHLSQLSYLLNNNLLNEIATHGILRHFNKNEIIIDIYQDITYIPILLKGNIKVTREDDKGNELLLYVLESGDTCAMSLTCCMSNKRSKIRATADKDSDVVLIPIKKMQEWLVYENWRNFIFQSYQTRFNEMLETIDTLAFMKMDERLHKYLIDQIKLNSTKVINTTHQQIAEDLNTSRVVVSRLLKQLETKNLIKISRNKIEVIDF